MIGQEKLIKQLNNFTYNSIPRTLLFVGAFGCGKHTLVDMLSTNFNVGIKNISNKLSYEKIIEFSLDPTPYIYLVDKELNPIEQNSLLKFIEEPPETARIIILAENENSLLETIKGRCQKFAFEKYSKEELSQFSNDENILNYFETPGEILSISQNCDWVFQLCDTIMTKIAYANIPNILTIPNKFDFGKEEEKFNVLVFMKLLMKKCLEYVESNKTNKYCETYLTISDYFNKMKLPQVDKKKLFELCLLEIKQKLRNDN